MQLASAMLAALIVACCAAAAFISRKKESSMNNSNSSTPESLPVPAASTTSIVSMQTSIQPAIKEETGISRFEEIKTEADVGSRGAKKTKRRASRKKKE
jgi:hypothetical protein